MSSLHINKAVKKRLFRILKLHISTINPLLLQLYTSDWRNIYDMMTYLLKNKPLISPLCSVNNRNKFSIKVQNILFLVG